MDFAWLKALMPRGIYGRAALILFLPVTVVTLVVTVMFLQRHFEGVTRQMTESLSRELVVVARRIDQANDRATAQLAGRALAGPLGLSLHLPAAPARDDHRHPLDLSGRVVIATLHEQVPQVRAVDLRDMRRVVVAMQGRWGPYSLGFDRRLVSATNPHQLLVLMVGTSLLMTVISTIFLRNQLRPIRRLARAAEDYGRGRVTPYRPSGASEVRSAGTAFLDMRNRIERQNEQRKLMLSGVSHDLRTPLTRLRLGLSMLTPDMPPDAADIDAMARDVDEMGAMIDAFLELARDDAQSAPPRPVRAIPFLRDIVADAQRAGQAVVLGRVQGDAEAQVTFRETALRRAVQNLIGNAVRYGNHAQVELVLGGGALTISVEDDGPGIPESRRDEAMRPFTRLDPARNQDKGQGVGLGLAIAADIARAHGGSLRLGRGRALGGLLAQIVIPR
ncbi:ATP-binding protein [Paracoccus jiaweipingae]|uniref:ATP-binding protein n=1 Tax=unclassified Paracoccus (in: a-proteobacteria) TaxID=2688777 RepID=UPI0037B4B4C8